MALCLYKNSTKMGRERDRERKAISVAFRVLNSGPSFMVQDAGARRIGSSPLVSEALNRKDVIGTHIAEEIFEVCDLIYLADPRIADLRQ